MEGGAANPRESRSRAGAASLLLYPAGQSSHRPVQAQEEEKQIPSLKVGIRVSISQIHQLRVREVKHPGSQNL